MTRLIDATIDPVLASSAAGSRVGSAVADSQATGPVFPIDVPIGLPILAIAVGSAAQQALLQIVTDNVSSVELSAASTAQALVFTTPNVMSSDPVEADARLAALASLPEILDLEQVVARSVAAGNDYLDDAAFQGRLFAAVRAFEQTLVLPPPSALSNRVGIPQLNRLDVGVLPTRVASNGIPNHLLEWNSTEAEILFGISLASFSRVRSDRRVYCVSS